MSFVQYAQQLLYNKFISNNFQSNLLAILLKKLTYLPVQPKEN